MLKVGDKIKSKDGVEYLEILTCISKSITGLENCYYECKIRCLDTKCYCSHSTPTVEIDIRQYNIESQLVARKIKLGELV